MQGQEEERTAIARETLKALVELQRLDDDIVRRRANRDKKPMAIAEKKNEVAEERAKADAAKQLVTDTQKKIDSLSVESQSIQTEVTKLDGQLFQLKTNDEFEAMKKQIAGKKAEDSKLQDQALELMMSIDELKERHQSAEDDVKDVEGQLARLEQIQVDEAARVDATIAEVEQKRADCAGSFEAENLELYEEIRARRDGRGIAAVESQICKGCDTQVLLQTVNLLMAGSRVQCPHCDRLLYLLEHVQG